jgi:toxin ParE1/3/4
MNSWKVVYTEQAESDLQGIFDYIAFSLHEAETAKKQVRRILVAIAKLDQMPLRHPLYEKDPWHIKGLRVLPADNFLAFYLMVETQKTVAVIRIMYGGCDIEDQLRQTEVDQ